MAIFKVHKKFYFWKLFRLDHIFARFRTLFLVFFFGYIFLWTLFPVIFFPDFIDNLDLLTI